MKVTNTQTVLLLTVFGENPLDWSPLESSPVQSTQVKSSPLSPLKSSPVQSSPVQSTQVMSSPLSPLQSTPESTQVQSSPVQSSPVQSSPLKSSQVKSSHYYIHALLTLTDMCGYHAQLSMVTSDIDMISVVFIRDKLLKLHASMSTHFLPPTTSCPHPCHLQIISHLH